MTSRLVDVLMQLPAPLNEQRVSHIFLSSHIYSPWHLPKMKIRYIKNHEFLYHKLFSEPKLFHNVELRRSYRYIQHQAKLLRLRRRRRPRPRMPSDRTLPHLGHLEPVNKNHRISRTPQRSQTAQPVQQKADLHNRCPAALHKRQTPHVQQRCAALESVHRRT